MIRALLGAAAILAATPSHAHYAPMGWMYPPECCSGTDCHQIGDNEVKLNRDGSYTVLATGEVFYAPGKIPISTGPQPARAYRWSQDEHFHRCNRDPSDSKSYTFCLFVPQPGS